VQIEDIDYSLWLKKDLNAKNTNLAYRQAGKTLRAQEKNSVVLCETSVNSVVKEIGKREEGR
jgi:hypothetical protein